MKKYFLFIIVLFLSNSVCSQSFDSLKLKNRGIQFNTKQLVVPTLLISFGVLGLENKQIKLLNNQLNIDFNKNENRPITIDNYTQYVPILATYGLNTFGIKGKNTIKDRTIILLTSYIIMGVTVNLLKNTTGELRPDLSKDNSFPSGHTATAFLGAEFMFQEFKNESIWYGITGYLIATGTGALRMYNNRHWFSDVIAGAGIGILSTKAAYWLAPKINKLFSNKSDNVVLFPYYDGKSVGVGFVSNF
jgi:membrane-associated phospholipid phosphatase